MVASAVEFAAKVDLWFLAVFYGAGLLMLASAALRKNQPAFVRFILVPLGLMFCAVAFLANNEVYVVTSAGDLIARGSWQDGRLGHADQIRQVTRSSNPRASRAASLDRLEIQWQGGGVVYIAVHDRNGFLDALAAASPGLVRHGDALLRE